MFSEVRHAPYSKGRDFSAPSFFWTSYIPVRYDTQRPNQTRGNFLQGRPPFGPGQDFHFVSRMLTQDLFAVVTVLV